MWEDIRRCAMDCGWAVALHGSLASDMDIMAMPWMENSTPFEEMIDKISKLFKDNELSNLFTVTYNEKPHNRIVATIPIFDDFYIDISTVVAEEVKHGEWKVEFHNGKKFITCSACGSVIDCYATYIDENEYDGCPYCRAIMDGGKK